jgi:hypothetical protein
METGGPSVGQTGKESAIAFLAGAALVWWFQRIDSEFLRPKAQRVDPGPLHDRKAQRIDPGPLHQKAQRIDPRIEHEFNKVFMTASNEGKEALIERWTDRKKCTRGEAMRLAIEEWRWENR